MERYLNDDLNIIQQSNVDPALLAALAFPNDLAVIQALDDEPNDVGGLTAAELKAKFDQAGLTIQRYINETLVPEVVANDATETQRTAAEAEREAAEALRVSETEGVVARAKQEADRAKDCADAAQEASRRGPYVGASGTWQIWDGERGGYRDTGVPARGPKGDRGEPGVLTSLDGGVFAMGLSPEGHLLVAVREDESAPPLEIDENGHLIYKIEGGN